MFLKVGALNLPMSLESPVYRNRPRFCRQRPCPYRYYETDYWSAERYHDNKQSPRSVKKILLPSDSSGVNTS